MTDDDEAEEQEEEELAFTHDTEADEEDPSAAAEAVETLEVPAWMSETGEARTYIPQVSVSCECAYLCVVGMQVRVCMQCMHTCV